MRQNFGEIRRGLDASVSMASLHKHDDKPDSIRTENFLVSNVSGRMSFSGNRLHAKPS